MRTPLPQRLLLALVVAGALVRVSTLTVQSLWLDEAFSVLSARAHSVAELWSPGIDPIHPPLFYVLLHASLNAFGDGVAAARLPSALASVAGLALVAWLAASVLGDRRAGWLAAALLALAPIDLWYAQEARMYALVALSATVTALGCWLDRPWAPVLAVIGAVAGLYLDHTMWPILIAIGALAVTWPATTRRSLGPVWRVALVVVAIALCCRPVWAQALVAYGELDKVSLFKNLAARLHWGSVTRVPLAVAMAACAALAVLVARALSSLVRRAGDATALPAVVTAVFVLATMACAYPRAYSAKQVLVCVWPLVTLAAAWAVARVRAEAPVLALCACACAFTFVTPRADWRGVVAHLTTRHAPSMRVVLDPPYNRQPWSFYRTAASPATLATDGRATDLLARLIAGGETLCLVAERFGNAPPTSPTEAWLDQHATLQSTTRFARLDVRCYGAPAGQPGK